MPTSGLTLSRLHSGPALTQVLHDLFSQRIALSLHALPEGSSEASMPQEDGSAQPFGIACMAQLNAEECSLVLHMSGGVLPFPAHALLTAHMAGGVKVQWMLEGTWQAVNEQHWLMTLSWPQTMLLLQRRRHPRVSIPLGQNYSASFRFGRRQCVLDIDDWSLGGLALRGTRQETAMLFMGRTLYPVNVQLADGTRLEMALQVRSRRRYHSFLLGEQVLVGCSVERISDEDKALLEAVLQESAARAYA